MYSAKGSRSTEATQHREVLDETRRCIFRLAMPVSSISEARTSPARHIYTPASKSIASLAGSTIASEYYNEDRDEWLDADDDDPADDDSAKDYDVNLDDKEDGRSRTRICCFMTCIGDVASIPTGHIEILLAHYWRVRRARACATPTLTLLPPTLSLISLFDQFSPVQRQPDILAGARDRIAQHEELLASGTRPPGACAAVPDRGAQIE